MKTYKDTTREASFAGDLGYVISVLREKALIIVLCLAVFAGLGFCYVTLATKIYSSTVVFQVEQEDQTVAKIDNTRTEDLKGPEILKTYEQNVTSPEVLLRVVNHPDMKGNPKFLPEVQSPRTENALQSALSLRISAKVRRDTRLIDVTVEDRNPALAKRLAELLAQEYLLWNAQCRRDGAEGANEFLHHRADDLAQRLAKAEHDLQQYKEQHSEVSLQDKQVISTGNLNQINLRIAEARAERLKLETDGAQFWQEGGHSAAYLLKIPSIANSPLIQEMLKRVSEKEAALAPLRERYSPDHPSLLAAQSELREVRTGLENAARDAATVLQARLKEARQTEEKLTASLRDQQRQTLSEDAIGIGYAKLSHDVEAARGMYDAVLKRMMETDVTKALDQDIIRVVAKPLLADLPSKPKKTIIMLLSIAAGLGLGCFIAFASHATNRSLQTLQDAESRLGLPLLGEIPRLPPSRKKSDEAADSLEVTESFSTLRTSISLLGNAAGTVPKNVLFTSAHAGEGKTFCAINCAIAYARQGLNTLIIDGDFRLPTVERILLGTAGAPGMSELLLSKAHMGMAVHPTAISNLHVLPAGKCVSNPGEILDHARLTAILSAVTEDFDRIVIDTAPVHIVSDTLLWVRHVEHVCLVIRAGRTPADDVLRTAQRLNTAGARLVGFVWNQVKPRNNYHQYYKRAAAAEESFKLLSKRG